MQERVIITKDDFHKIDHLGNINEKRFFNYRNGMVFFLDAVYNTYSGDIYKKLRSGVLDQLILNRKSVLGHINAFMVNYELEDQQRTKLKDLYPEIANS